jgi:hypothetical protein
MKSILHRNLLLLCLSLWLHLLLILGLNQIIKDIASSLTDQAVAVRLLLVLFHVPRLDKTLFPLRNDSLVIRPLLWIDKTFIELLCWLSGRSIKIRLTERLSSLLLTLSLLPWSLSWPGRILRRTRSWLIVHEFCIASVKLIMPMAFHFFLELPFDFHAHFPSEISC